MSDLEIEHGRLSRRDAIAAAIVGSVFGIALAAVLVFVIGRAPAPKPSSTPMVLPAEDKP